MKNDRAIIVMMTTIIIFVVLFVLFLWVYQAKLIYFPRRYHPQALVQAKGMLVELDYHSSQGKQLAFWVPPRQTVSGEAESLRQVWLLFGGNASTALDWLFFLDDLSRSGVGFLLIDYPGYGKCEGKPSPTSMAESIELAFERLRKYLSIQIGEEASERLLAENVSVLGHSLGAAAALIFAEQYAVQRVVLVSPFTSMQEMARRSVGRALSFLLSHQYDNRGRLKNILAKDSAPAVYIIHGQVDEVIPVEMGRELAERFNKQIQYQEIKGGDHNQILESAGKEIISAMYD